MNSLILHIEYLLRRNDCVIIPSLGAFIASRRPAYYDRETRTVTPPRREVVFNASIVNNDGLLANSVARRMGITYTDALEHLMHTAAQMHDTLRRARKLDMGRLGSLALGVEDNIIFTPRHEVHQIYPGTLSLKGVDAIPAASAPDQVQTKQRRWRTDKYYYLPIHKGMAKVAACLVVLIVMAVGVFHFTPADAPGQPDRASVIPVAVEKIHTPTPTAPVQQTDTIAAETYHLVVGTFTNNDEVARFMAKYADKGFQLKAITGKRYIRVTAASDHDRDRLVALMRTEKIDTCFRSAWIWKE